MRSRFSKRAQAVLAAAHGEARAGGSSEPGAMYILAAVLRESKGSGVALLKRAGVDLGELGSALTPVACAESACDAHEWSAVLDAALVEARRFGHETAGTSHILLGILRHGRSQAAGILRRSGLELVRLRQLVLSYGGEKRSTAASAGGQRPHLFAAASEWESETESSQKLVERPDLERAILTVMGRSRDPHLVLVGPSGAGKRTLLRTVTRRLAGGATPIFESPVRALRLELLRLVGWRWQRAQQKLASFLGDIRSPGPLMLVIDDVDVFAGSEHWEDAAFFLRLVLANSGLPVVCVCEPYTYERVLKLDPFISPRVTLVEVRPPRGEEALRILRTMREHLEAYHGIRIADEAVDQAFISATEAAESEAFQLACRVLDEAAANLRVARGGESQTNGAYLERQLAELLKLKEDAVKAQDYKRAAEIRDEEQQLREEKIRLALNDEGEGERVVDAAAVVKILDPALARGVQMAWDQD